MIKREQLCKFGIIKKILNYYITDMVCVLLNVCFQYHLLLKASEREGSICMKIYISLHVGIGVLFTGRMGNCNLHPI